jgi:hypothetical protein
MQGHNDKQEPDTLGYGGRPPVENSRHVYFTVPAVINSNERELRERERKVGRID